MPRGSANKIVFVSSIVRLRDSAVVKAALTLTNELAKQPYDVAVFPLIRPPFGEQPFVY